MMKSRQVIGAALLICAVVAGGSADGLTKLNNLCWEILNETPGGAPAPSYSFDNPRKGWVYFITETTGDLTFAVPDASPQTIHDPANGPNQEAMRWMSAGTHQINVSGAGNLDRLVVRSVASAFYCQYPSNPHVTEYGLYDWHFLMKYVLPSSNSIICSSTLDRLLDWTDQGGRWIQNTSKPDVDSAQDVYDYLIGKEGITNPNMHGMIIDEFWTGISDIVYWKDGSEMVFNDYPDKMIMPYFAGSIWFGNMADYLNMVMAHGSYFGWERYTQERRTESDMSSQISSDLGGQMWLWDWVCPGSKEHMIVVLGYLSQPPESNSINPGANFKVMMDMQFNHLATDSRFDGLAGIMEYLSSYCDEENVRWQGRLFRHYILEGNTSMCSSDPYVLSHIQNPDFESGTSGWTITEAEPGSISTGSYSGYSWLEGRYPKTSQGDTFLKTTRSAAAPNAFSQTISNLEPGRYYSMKMITGDYQDLVNGVSNRQEHAISITIDNVAVLRLPDKSFAHIYPQCYSHDLGPFNRSHRYYMNFHWRVFKALATTATLTVSDWSAPDDPGGDAGQELMFNFIEIQPYLYDQECALSVRSRPVTSVDITADPDQLGGVTDYSFGLKPNTQVSLTAPATLSEGGAESTFIRWNLIPNLAAHYPINALTGTTVEDVSGHGNHGTIEGATWVETGWGNALSFDGVDDYVACETWNSLDITGAVTLSVWINPDQMPAGETWVAGKDFTRFLMTYYTDGRCWWYIRGGGNSCKTAVSVGQWSHVVGTFDGVTLRLYVNGQLMDEKVSAHSEIPAGMDFRIGGNESGACFAGKVGDVKVYARALSLTEVQNEHASGPETYAGNPQPDGQTTVTYTAASHMMALAEYTAPTWPLGVRSIPITGVEISGTYPGDTDYSARAPDKSEVTLTATDTASEGDTDYEFVRWNLVEHLSAHYPFDEGAGDVLHDASGSMNDGTIDGATWVAEGDGYALSFDGVENRVNCGRIPRLDSTGSITLTVWIRPDEVPPSGVERVVAGKLPSFRLTYYADGRCWWYAGGQMNAAVTAATWSHIAGVFDASDQTMKLYVNGDLRGTVASTYSWIPRGDDFSIGRIPSSMYGFKGRITNVKLYARALSDTEIQNDYGTGVYAGAAQPDGETTMMFDMQGTTTTVAEYSVVKRNLDVQSTPITSVPISGTPSGTTDYSAELDDNSTVTLEAPAAFAVGDTDYVFVKWTVNGGEHPESQTTLTFAINEATTAVAEYVRVKRALQVQSTPVQGVDISGTFPGVTNYSVDVDDNSAVTLTAPERAIVGDTSYEFVKWVLDAADQPEGQTSIAFVIQDATTALAQYILYKPALQVQSLPVTDVTISGTHPGMTNYSTEADNNSQVTLTAPETVSQGDADYVFVRWHKTDNLVGYYPFDEAAGETAFDASGHKNHGAIIGAQWAAGLYAGALTFDGVDDFVDCRVRDSLCIESAGTILLWLNPTVCQGGLVNWSTGGGWPDERLVLTFKTYGTAEKLGVYMADGTSYAYVYEGPFPPVGEWMHFALTFDGSSVAAYRDGAQVYTGGQAVTPNLENVPMWIGKSLGLGSSYFNGLIDEVRIYNRALSADEVEREYLNGPGTYAGAEQPEGDTTISFIISEPTIVVAEYAPASLLQVRSTPIAGVQISGTCPGTTTYTKLLAHGADVTLTAPETFTEGSDQYQFVRWVVNSADQPDGQATVTFNVNGDTTAEAVYTLKGDFDGDGDIDDLDLAAFVEVYGLSEGDPGWAPNGPIADFDDDDDVDFQDFMEFVDVYGM